jgi:hypothetical protein
MASHYFAIELGEGPADVERDTSTLTKTVEVAVNLADNATRSEVLVALQHIAANIATGAWPPA